MNVKKIIILFFSAIITIVISVLYTPVYQILEENKINANRTDNYETNIEYFIFIVLLGPIIEEFLYRKGLKYSKTGTTLLIIGIIYTVYTPFQPVAEELSLVGSFLILIVLVLLFFTVKHFFVSKNEKKIKIFYANHLWIIVSIASIFFAYSHFSLYQNYMELKYIALSPIILFPYFLAGIVFSLIRLKLGFLYGCLGHSLCNCIIFFCNFYNFF